MMLLTHRILRRLMLWHLIGGALAGVFVLQPVNDLIYFFQAKPDAPSALSYVGRSLLASLVGPHLGKGLFYALVGAALGAAAAWVMRGALQRNRRIVQLTMELERDLVALIARGEGSRLEFKSSFRWDVNRDKLNRQLEHAVLKSVAAFLNGEGGTLLVGVADDGTILGLDADYQTLKKRDRDGFEQAVMTAVAERMGADVCANIQVVFHGGGSQEVCRLSVLPSPRPVYLTRGNETEFYVRTGTSTRQLNVQEGIEYINNRWPK